MTFLRKTSADLWDETNKMLWRCVVNFTLLLKLIIILLGGEIVSSIEKCIKNE